MNSFLLTMHLSVLLFAILCVSSIFEEVNGNVIADPSVRARRTVGRRRNRQGPTSSQLSDVLNRFSADGSFLGDLSMYTPPTPRPQDVNCYVEVPTTTLVGGRCMSLGSQSPVCQAGAYLAFSTECQNSSSSRFRRAIGQHPRRGPAVLMPDREGN